VEKKGDEEGEGAVMIKEEEEGNRSTELQDSTFRRRLFLLKRFSFGQTPG